MDTVGIRELGERASAVVGDVERTGHAVLVTRRGRPVAVVSAIDEEALLDFVLAGAPEYVRGMRAAEDAYAAGTSESRPLADVLAALAAEEAGENSDGEPAAGA
jgi:prevent-host-death family protein